MSKRKPAVLFLIGSMREGGAENDVVHLLKGLKARGWRVGLMLLHCEGMRLQEVRDAGIEVFDVALPRFRPRWSPLPWLRLVNAWLRTRQFLQHWQPDVLHAFLFWAHLWAWLTIPDRVCLVTSRLQTGPDPGKVLAVERWINRRADLIISNSRAVDRAAAKREGSSFRKARRTVIYNGVNLEKFDSAQAADLRTLFPELATAESIAITVANVLEYKGYPILAKAWKIVQERFPGAKVLCVGSTAGSHYNQVQRALEENGLTNHVIFAGSRNDVPSLLKGADLAVHASYTEGFSNAILEQMAAELSVVATDVGGAREALANGRAGKIVPPRNAEALARAICEMLTNRETAKKLGVLARSRLEKRFTVRAMLTAHAKEYKRLISLQDNLPDSGNNSRS